METKSSGLDFIFLKLKFFFHFIKLILNLKNNRFYSKKNFLDFFLIIFTVFLIKEKWWLFNSENKKLLNNKLFSKNKI